MNISGEAIESALEAFWANEDEPYVTAMRRALEAAAPHLMAQAWEQGFASGREDEYFLTENPYRWGAGE